MIKKSCHNRACFSIVIRTNTRVCPYIVILVLDTGIHHYKKLSIKSKSPHIVIDHFDVIPIGCE